MQVELREIQRKLGVTTIFVTHDQSEAFSLSDRLALMSEGGFASSARRRKSTPGPATGLSRPLSVTPMCCAAGFSAPPGADVVLTMGAAQVRVPIGSLQGAAVSAPVDLYVRPEHLEIIEASGPCARSGTIVGQVSGRACRSICGVHGAIRRTAAGAFGGTSGDDTVPDRRTGRHFHQPGRRRRVRGSVATPIASS